MTEIVYDPSKRYVKGGASGSIYEVLGEHGGNLWLLPVEKAGAGTWTNSEPRTIAKINTSAFTPPPVTIQAGDIVRNGRADGYEYRVLGVTDTQMLIVKREDYADGDWPVLRSDDSRLQKDVILDEDVTVYIRQNPDSYLKFKSRP